MAQHWGFDDEDLLRRQLLVVSMWSIYEKTYYAHEYDHIGPEEWERFETACATTSVRALSSGKRRYPVS